MNNTDVAAVILAAGKGKRIGPHLPKALYPIAGKPMLHYALELLKRVPINDLTVVVGFRASEVKATIGEKAKFVLQPDQLGTAHALSAALEALSPNVKTVLVINGDDSAFYEPSTIREFINVFHQSGSPLGLISLETKSPHGLGRLVRDRGNLIKIVEEAEASASQRLIGEVNTGCYLIDVGWAKENLVKINKSSQDEYYLTDAVGLVLAEGRKVTAFKLGYSHEWMGVNTQEELVEANRTMISKLVQMNKPTVTIIDLDNTLLDTQRVKVDIPGRITEVIRSSLGFKISSDDFSKIFWKIYEDLRRHDGFVDIPSVISEVAKRYSISNSYVIQDALFSIPFNQYILVGVMELLDYLRKWSKVVIFGDGDLVFGPVKLDGMELNGKYDDVYFVEQKPDFVESLIQIYADYRTIVVDDQIRNLELFENKKSAITTVLIKHGPYSNQKPLRENFKTDFTVSSLPDALRVFRREVFSWT